MNRPVYTIGHSTHSADEFIIILQTYAIEMLVDVRTIAKSRHNPQFAEDALREHLRTHGIEYMRLEGLGGLRHTSKTSQNIAWKNLSFRGYADYMQTPEFARSMEHLVKISEERQVAIMCAEAVPWRCHRALIGDALLVRNIAVIDIMSEKTSRPRVLTPFAVVEGESITYPGNDRATNA